MLGYYRGAHTCMYVFHITSYKVSGEHTNFGKTDREAILTCSQSECCGVVNIAHLQSHRERTHAHTHIKFCWK